jgi:hypothetical protein
MYIMPTPPPPLSLAVGFFTYLNLIFTFKQLLILNFLEFSSHSIAISAKAWQFNFWYCIFRFGIAISAKALQLNF